MNEALKQKLVELAITAPSGDNSQPISFLWQNDTLEIYNNPALAENRKFNFGNMGAIIGLGATTEIIRLAALASGFNSEVQLTENFDKNENSNLPWAKIYFKPIANPTPHSKSDLALKPKDILSQIEARHINRELYKGGDFTSALKQELLSNVILPKDFSVDFIQFSALAKEERKSLIKHLSHTEAFVYTDLEALEDVGKWVRLTRKAANTSQDGMHWSQLAMKSFEVPILYMFRYLPTLSIKLFSLGLGVIIRSKITQALNSSAGLVVIWGPTAELKQNLLSAGSIGTHLWIKLNSYIYGVQPLSTMSALGSYLIATQNQNLISNENIKYISAGQDLLRQICKKNKNQWPLWMFRAGLAEPLSKNKISLRRPFQTFLKEKSSS